MPILPTPLAMPPQQQDAPSQVQGGGALGGLTNSVSGIVNMIANYHKAKMNQAGVTAQRMMSAAQAGFMPDPKAFLKTMKQAGVPLISGTDADAMVNHGDTPKPAAGAQPGLKQPKQQEQQDQKFNVASIADVKQRQQRETELQVDGVLRQAVTNAKLQGATDAHVLQQTQTMLDLKDKAIKGDMQALGTLYRIGEVKVPVDMAAFASMDPRHQAGVMDMMAGMETEQQKTSRVANTAQSLVTEGRFASLEDATKYSNAVLNGQPVPPELQSKMIQHPLTDMLKAFEGMDTLAHMGYSGQSLVDAAQRFAVGGLNSIPAPAQNLYVEAAKTQRMNAQAASAEAGAAVSRAGMEKESVEGFNRGVPGKPGQMEHVPGTLESVALERQSQMLKVEAVMKTQDDKDFLALFTQNMLQNRAKPGSVPAEVMNAYTDELVRRSGGVVTQEAVKHWFTKDTVKSNYSWPEKGDTGSSQAPGAP